MDRPETVSRPARLLRGWAAAVVSTLCAASSHFAVNPAAPDPVLLGLSLAIAGAVCVLLAGRRLGAVRTAGAVALSQLPFHALFSAGGHTAHGAGHAAASSSAHHAHTVAAQTADAPGVEQIAAVTGHGSMLWAHVAAAVVTYVLVRHAEDGWWRLVHAAVRVIFTAVQLLVPALVPCHAPRPVPPAFLLPPRTFSLVRVIRRRGPPLLSI